MIKTYLAPFAIAAIISGGLTFSVRFLALKFGWVDLPGPRKIHKVPIPRLGGVAIALSFFMLAIAYNLITQRLEFSSFHVLFFEKRLLGVLLGAFILLVAGIYDDIKGLVAWQKLIFQILAAAVAIVFGIGISYLRLPGGYHINLDQWVIPIRLFGETFSFVVWGDLLTMFWLVLMINTMNFLDGLDGLAGGVSAIAAIAMFFLSLSLGQFPSALLCLILAGAALGFLPWNFHPARIFMGDSGSMFLGYILGVLAVISGGKLATAFLVLGIPVLDVIWVAIRRIINGKSPFTADKLHLHHRMLSAGLTQRQTVLLLYIISAAFGTLAVFSGTDQKGKAAIYLVLMMVALAIGLIILEYRKKQREKNV